MSTDLDKLEAALNVRAPGVSLAFSRSAGTMETVASMSYADAEQGKLAEESLGRGPEPVAEMLHEMLRTLQDRALERLGLRERMAERLRVAEADNALLRAAVTDALDAITVANANAESRHAEARQWAVRDEAAESSLHHEAERFQVRALGAVEERLRKLEHVPQGSVQL